MGAISQKMFKISSHDKCLNISNLRLQVHLLRTNRLISQFYMNSREVLSHIRHSHFTGTEHFYQRLIFNEVNLKDWVEIDPCKNTT